MCRQCRSFGLEGKNILILTDFLFLRYFSPAGKQGQKGGKVKVSLSVLLWTAREMDDTDDALPGDCKTADEGDGRRKKNPAQSAHVPGIFLPRFDPGCCLRRPSEF